MTSLGVMRSGPSEINKCTLEMLTKARIGGEGDLFWAPVNPLEHIFPFPDTRVVPRDVITGQLTGACEPSDLTTVTAPFLTCPHSTQPGLVERKHAVTVDPPPGLPPCQ